MNLSLLDRYREINNTNDRILLQSLSQQENEIIQAKGHNYLIDLNSWLVLLNGRPEIGLYEAAFKEYHFALIFISQGFYRQGYNSLRFFIEHTLAALFFSSRELEFRLWKLGQQDIYWSNILDQEQGFFSLKYFNAFAPFLIDERLVYRNLAKDLYRGCSEFIHGNYSTYRILPESLKYNETIFKEWHDKAEQARQLIIFSLSVRFLGELSNDEKVSLESSVMEQIGHLKSVEQLFQMREEATMNG